ncbi:hypothetical protein LSAT2_001739 [Lamellibrachia satsuma]|nr:hypothetical protein LSAT2_001739 [Lamellibrachia satsuma]
MQLGSRFSGDWSALPVQLGSRFSGDWSALPVQLGSRFSGDWSALSVQLGSRFSGDWSALSVQIGSRFSGDWSALSVQLGSRFSGDWSALSVQLGSRFSGDWSALSVQLGSRFSGDWSAPPVQLGSRFSGDWSALPVQLVSKFSGEWSAPLVQLVSRFSGDWSALPVQLGSRYLLEHGADVASVNNDGDLAIDLAEGEDVEELLLQWMEKEGVDADAARREEEEIMLWDANQWLNSEKYEETPHPKSGASAMHVAAAKGYIKVMHKLVEAGANLDLQDFDGWTPLHAAAHWGQEEACKVLAENLCNMDLKTNNGQTALDLADADLEPLLEELKEKQELLKKDKESQLKAISIRGGAQAAIKRRSSVTRMSGDQKQNLVQKNVDEERQKMEAMRGQVVEDKKAETNVMVEEEEGLSSSSSEEDEEEEEEEDSSSDSETKKQNEINIQSTLSTIQTKPTPLMNQCLLFSRRNGLKPALGQSVRTGTATTTATTTTPIANTIEKPPTETKRTNDEIKIPPPAKSSAVTPRIQDVATTEQTKKDDANKENTNLEPGKRERTVVMKPEAEAGVGRKELRKEDKEEDSKEAIRKNERKEDAVKKEEVETEDKSSDNERPMRVPNSNLINRINSAPHGYRGKLGTHGGRQVPSFTPRPMSATTEMGPDGPTSWRAGLRKAGSSSAVPETVVTSSTTSSNDSDKLARSASSSWLASDKGDAPMRRQYSTGISDSYETRNRFNDFYTRYSSLLSSNRSNTSSSLTSSAASSTRPTSDQQYVPLSRRRQLEREQRERERMLGLSSIVTTTRLYEAPKRDEEKEIERKAKARKARSTRRSTQGVTKEDIERAELALQAANKGIDLAAVSANKRLSENKENKPEGNDDTSAAMTRRKVWTDEDTRASLRKLRGGAGDLTVSASDTSSTLSGLRGSSSTSTTVPSITTSDTTMSTPSSSFRSSYRSKYVSTDDDRKTDEGTRDEWKKQGSKEEKDDPSQKSSAIRTRRKRENRRPTGKITLDDLPGSPNVDDIDDSKTKKDEEKTSSRYGTSSRYSDTLGSSSSLYDSSRYLSRSDRPSSYSGSTYSRSHTPTSVSQDKEVDYKKLYEHMKGENERLQKDLQKVQQEVTNGSTRNETSRSLDMTLEKREKRALERKISELEEELKLMDRVKADNARLKEENRALTRAMENLKADNQRLKEENGALIRVISKLSK